MILSYTGGYQTFTVPSGLTVLSATLLGGAGGCEWYGSDGNPGTIGSLGGAQGRLVVEIPVTPGETLRVYVGGRGTHGTNGSPGGGVGGWNGGGDTPGWSLPGGGGGTYTGRSLPGGGGGASDIRRYISGSWTRIVVAGGGGGGGGNGNTPTDAYGGNGSGGNGAAGNTGSGGAPGQGGGGGTSSAPGAGGAGPGGDGVGGSGSQGGQGGAPPPGSGQGRGGGGGGGGYYGGGGGGEATLGGGGGGGGGGSGYAAAGITILTADSVPYVWEHGSVFLDIPSGGIGWRYGLHMGDHSGFSIG